MEWISVDKLPPHTGAYLITDGRIIGEGYWSPANGWEIDRDSRLCGFMDVQYWTPFPELPKERHNDWNRELLLADGITVTERLPGTPVQYIGQCDGQWYYFRARHQHWRMAIASTAEAATCATSSVVDRELDRESAQQSPIQTANAIVFFYAGGFYGAEPDAAGYMPLEQVEEIIRRCVRLWRVAQIEQK